MVRAIVDHVAALAQALQIAPPVVTRVVVEVRRSQDHAGVPDLRGFDEIGPARRPTAAIAPNALRGIKPASRRADIGFSSRAAGHSPGRFRRPVQIALAG